MRRFLTGFVVAAVIAVVPALALAGNQQVAEQIANRLRNSGQMSDYKIGVKYQNGTAWLHGRVSSPEQMKTALRLVFKTDSVDRVVNELSVAPSETAQPAKTELASDHTNDPGDQRDADGHNPLRDQDAGRLRRQATAENEPGEAAASGRAAELQGLRLRNRCRSVKRPLPATINSRTRPSRRPSRKSQPRSRKSCRRPGRPAGGQSSDDATELRGPVAPNGAPMPMYQAAAAQAGVAPARYDQPCMPNYAWPSYAAYPNYAAVTYPKQYSPTAWPYIGPFYPYPQVPLGWRKVTLEWDSGWWFLDFKDQPASCWQR